MNSPVTVLEGNHRLTAALLASPEVLQLRFRVFCGLSPRMSESCWYQTNLPNFGATDAIVLAILFYDRDADVERVLKPSNPTTAAARTLAHAATQKPVGDSK